MVMHHDDVSAQKVEDAQGGAATIQEILDMLGQFLDLARSPQSGTYTFADADEETLYEESDDKPFQFHGGFIDFTGANAGAGEDTTVKIYIKVKSGGTYRLIWESLAFLNAAVPDPPCVQIPNIGDEVHSATVLPPFYNVYGVKVTAQQAAEGGGWNSLDHEWFDSKRGN